MGSHHPNHPHFCPGDTHVAALLFQADCMFWPAAGGAVYGWCLCWNKLGRQPVLSGVTLGGGVALAIPAAALTALALGSFSLTQKAAGFFGSRTRSSCSCFKSHFSFCSRVLVFSPESCCWMTDCWNPMTQSSCPKTPKVVLQFVS